MPRKSTRELPLSANPKTLTYEEIATFFNVQRMSVRNALKDFSTDGGVLPRELWYLVQVGIATERGMMPKNPNARRSSLQPPQRARILDRDGKRCRYCGKATTAKTIRIDHILPWALGGRNYDTNLVICCFTCNMRKGDRTVLQASMTLLPPPNGDEALNDLQQGLAWGIIKYQYC